MESGRKNQLDELEMSLELRVMSSVFMIHNFYSF